MKGREEQEMETGPRRGDRNRKRREDQEMETGPGRGERNRMGREEQQRKSLETGESVHGLSPQSNAAMWTGKSH